jgi:chaperone required for assembly of F1-ATPase
MLKSTLRLLNNNSILKNHFLKSSTTTTANNNDKRHKNFNVQSMANRQNRKRFYKNVTVIEAKDNTFELMIDDRRLKTPSGGNFKVFNKLLANMISAEWLMQNNEIKANTMHLTSLVNTASDNPNKLTTKQIIASLKEYLITDTILFFDDVTSSNKKLNGKLKIIF